MKNLIGLAVATLLVTGGVCAETIGEAETNLKIKAAKFENHPLHQYMVPEGYEALWLVLRNIGSYCTKAPNNTTKECASQRLSAVEQLREFGFDDVEAKDFESAELFQLARDAENIHKSKIKAVSRQMSKLPMKEQRPYRERVQALEKMVRDMRLHLINSRKK